MVIVLRIKITVEIVMTTAMLEALGCSVTHCATGKDAEKVYAEKSDEIDLVILDMVLPDATGADIFQKLIERNPKVNCLVASGYSNDEHIQALIDNGAKGFIQKPFKLAQLSAKLEELLP